MTSDLFVATNTPVLDFSDVCFGFESQGRLPHLHAINSSDSPLLTSWWPAWQLSHFDRGTYIQALVGLESRFEHATALQQVTRQMFYRLSKASSVSISSPYPCWTWYFGSCGNSVVRDLPLTDDFN